MINIVSHENVVDISHFSKSGDIEIARLHVPPDELFMWGYATKNRSYPGILSHDGKPVRKITNDSIKRRGLNRFRIEEFLMSSDNYISKERLDSIYEYNVPKKYFFDIEVEITDGFPSAFTAKNAVTAISYCSTVDDTITVFSTKQLSPNDKESINSRLNEYFKKYNRTIRFKHCLFSSETSMLETFFAKAVIRMPLLTGWNVIEYDWRYLVNRANLLNIDISVTSPTGTLFGEHKLPQHRLVVDYLEIYKKWDKSIKIKESNSLDFVSKQALKLGKVVSQFPLAELYIKDYPSYIFYNAVDTYLVKLLDEQLNTMNTFLMLGNIIRTEAYKAFKPVWLTETEFCRMCYNHNRVIVKNYDDSHDDESDNKIIGGYVKLPKSGLFHNVVCFDFASMYPHIQMQNGISPETYLGQIEKLDKSKLNLNTVTITPSGAVFDRTTEGFLPQILREKYDRRKESKTKFHDILLEIDYLKSFIQ